MKIHFWGVRGSLPSPGEHTLRYGGNTPCVSVDLDDRHTLIFDAGSGLFRLGQRELSGPHTFYLLLSHLHWDHIQGFPMFRVHMNPDVTVRILTEMNPSWTKHVLSQLDGIHFPITADELLADVAGQSSNLSEIFSGFNLNLKWIRLNHRGECYGYRLDSPTGSLAYITDHEMDAVENVYLAFDELAEFCRDVSILIHDAHYVQEEMPAKIGMGHSTVERVCDLVGASGAKQIVLFHHDPDRTDGMLDANVRLAERCLSDLGSSATCVAAREGMELDL